MKNDHDMDLLRLFEEIREPGQDEIFVGGVSKRIARHRGANRVMLILLSFVGAAILAALTPWLMGLTGYIALGSSLLANSVLAVIISPVGWAIGGGVGLYSFLQSRS
jgi:nucleoside permease NupC